LKISQDISGKIIDILNIQEIKRCHIASPYLSQGVLRAFQWFEGIIDSVS
jgi:hypothetical protein